MELGNRIAIQLKPGTDLKELVKESTAKLSRTVAPDVFILQAPDAMTAMREAEAFSNLPEVVASYPVMRRPVDLQGAYSARPNDQYYAAQWNLEDRNSSGTAIGTDLNVRAAWPFTYGEGVTIAVADVGVELDHIELAPRAVGAPHFNFTGQSTNVTPAGSFAAWAHGTEIAGLAVAEINNGKGMAGVAPKANLASWVIADANLVLASDEQLMEMYQYAANTVGVQVHCWAIDSAGLNGPTTLEQIGISNAVNAGRFGRGVVMVRSAGNDRNDGSDANADGYSSDPQVISVGAIHRDGRPASYTEHGACVLVAAPSGDNGVDLFSTDLLGTNGVNNILYCPSDNPDCPNKDLSDYVYNGLAGGGFNGTSAAAAQTAGVAALVLSSNTNLTYRDVQQILIFSARHFAFVDPDMKTNGAGFRVSHNIGYGVPDAGAAVRLARNWLNRPPLTNHTFLATNSALIPDDGLRVSISDAETILQSLAASPSSGLDFDTPTASLPLVDVGFATNTITEDLTGKAALIERGGLPSFTSRVQNVAQAGAVFAIVRNNVYGPNRQIMALDYAPIPAVMINKTDGDALLALLQAGSVNAEIQLFPANYSFAVTNTLICEHVGVRIKTGNLRRADIRITLLSPQGTRSVLQRVNFDASTDAPIEWTYFSTHHFYESSAGTWTVSISDQDTGVEGEVQEVELKIFGTTITDSDADGLDDNWETNHFSSLAAGPRNDPDKDGNNHAREQILGTNPNAVDVSFELNFSRLNSTLGRLSWPSSEAFHYDVQTGTNVAVLNTITNVPGKFPETEWFTPFPASGHQFFRVRAVPMP